MGPQPAPFVEAYWVILVAAVLVSTAIALLRGGRLSALSGLEIRYGWLAVAAVALQYPFVFNQIRDGVLWGLPVAQWLLAVSAGMLAWVVWANRRLPGLSLVGLGLGLNVLVMACNGGWMPIAPEALERLGHSSWVSSNGESAKVWGAKNVMRPLADTRLWWLSDVIVLTRPFPLPTAFSPGDVLIAAGVFWLLQSALRPPVAVGRRQEAGASAGKDTGRRE